MLFRSSIALLALQINYVNLRQDRISEISIRSNETRADVVAPLWCPRDGHGAGARLPFGRYSEMESAFSIQGHSELLLLLILLA